MISLKKSLRGNKVSIGSWVTLGHPSIPEIMSKAGFDWLAVDMEHSAVTLAECQRLVQVIGLSGTVPLVRVGENDPALIKRVMDCGAYGVIVPMVNSEDDALRAVRAVKYPPAGTRGVGLARAQGYGLEFGVYRKWVGRESVVIAQVEHIDSVNNLEEILSVEGIDGSIIGPYDLSGSLGCPGEFDRPEVKGAIRRYEDVCKKMKRPMGFHIVEPDIRAALAYKKKGYTFLAVGLDTLYIGRKCLEVTAALSGRYERKL